jgi:alpha-aminoadipate carrier protein LysW
MVRCPDCSATIDLDEDEVEEGEIMSCPECEAELEVVSKSPVQLNSLSDEDEEEDEEEELEEEDLGDDDEGDDDLDIDEEELDEDIEE